jgi:serine/threonine protein kinase
MNESGQGSRVGTQFGPYRLRRLLGRGGMGEVYEAEDTVKDRVVALKLMTGELSSDPVFRQRMQREAHTAGRLQEPHIVPIHDYGEIDGQLFIDMRYVEGTDVSTVVHRGGPLPPPRAVAITRQIASALDAAHRAGVIHRDIKPENILLNDEDFAYLVDFGIAAAFTDQHLTKTGAAVGTWNYMAPERFGNNEITYHADIYALTCVLYECLTGTPPYPTDSLPALMAAHLTQPIPRPSHHNPAIPTAFDHVIARGMAKNPADRYPTTGDLARAAHDALSATDQYRATTLLEHSQQSAPPASRPIPWTQPPPWTPPPTRSNRKPWLILGAATLTIAVLVGTGIWLTTSNTPSNRKPVSTKTTTSTTTSEPAASVTTATTNPPPTVAPVQLSSILLTPASVDTIMGTSNLQPKQITTQMDSVPAALSNPDCIGALFPRKAPVYAGSGYTAISSQVLSGGQPIRFVDQSVVAFPTADQADAFLKNSAANWEACAGQSITDSAGRQPITWTVGNLNGGPPTIAQSETPIGGIPCQRALRVVSNVVLDVDVCTAGVTDQGSRVADAMAANVPK